MLSQSRVLDFIKSNLGFPFMQLEINDEDILDYVTNYTLKEFSYYSPEVKRIGLNLDLVDNQVPSKSNEYYIEDPEGREILNVKNIYSTSAQYVATGHPPMGPLSYGELKEWTLGVETSMTLNLFSDFDITFEFTHPNIIRISGMRGSSSGFVTVEYERMQSTDLSGVPNDLQWIFMEFALSDIQIVLGRIRKRYSDIKTPFGEVPISAEIGDEGKEKKRELIEKLSLGPMTNIIFDRG